jgi:serine acetyltransferase
MNQANDGTEMGKFIAEIQASVESLPASRRERGSLVPDSAALDLAIKLFRSLAFPGFFAAQPNGASATVEHNVEQLVRCLVPQVLAAMHVVATPTQLNASSSQALIQPQEVAMKLNEKAAAIQAAHVVAKLVSAIPAIRALLAADAAAAFDGDPAAQSVDEVILCYPGLQALIVHRFAHELHGFGAPLVPRMLSEIAHRRTGIDIHPGATIGAGLFIDHGTGVVIGQTTVIGKRCKIYQGVTLGAKSFEQDENGRARKNYKRHPTLEDHVTVYALSLIHISEPTRQP